jgi:hypothetical protein
MTDEARQPTEEELRAAYEAEIKQVRVEQILLENIVTLVNMGMRRTGLIPGTEDERDPLQVMVAIEGVRAHLPLIEQIAPEQNQPIQDAVSQLQMAFVQIGGAEAVQGAAQAAEGAATGATPPQAAPTPPPAAPPKPGPILPGQGGPAQKSGKLWIPGQ